MFAVVDATVDAVVAVPGDVMRHRRALNLSNHGPKLTTSILDSFLGGAAALLGEGADARLVFWTLVVLGALACLCGALLGRQRLVGKHLGERKEWGLVPADEFDPTLEEIKRFAFQLTRVLRRGPVGWLTRPAQAVRLSWTLDDGRVLASVEGPRYAAGVVRAAVLDRCELRDLEEGALGLVFAARSAGRPGGARERHPEFDVEDDVSVAVDPLGRGWG